MGFKRSINHSATTVSYSIDSFFDISYNEPNNSPIDNYFEKTDSLNKLITYYDSVVVTNPPSSAYPSKTLYNLILLGYMSVVESYFRELIRKLVLIDEHSAKHCEKHSLKYGAAIIHSKDILPEALLEGYSFANQSRIAEALKEFLDIKNIYNDSQLKQVAQKFNDICQLRHILIHRYGKLGIDNFINLRDHSLNNCIEKPIDLNSAKLFNISVVCNNLILVFNQFISDEILSRTAVRANCKWTWDFRVDRKEFSKYYKIFECNSNPPATGKPDIFTLYNDLRTYGKALR